MAEMQITQEQLSAGDAGSQGAQNKLTLREEIFIPPAFRCVSASLREGFFVSWRKKGRLNGAQSLIKSLCDFWG
jgi:hypothetical protein